MALTEEQLKEIREHLHDSENPLFFFDDDCDGLISFLLLRRFLGRGIGVAVKNPPLDLKYLRKIDECLPDKVFVLDVPIIDQEFVDNINIPLIWIDHHKPLKLKGVKYYNPRVNDDKDSRCVSYWCHRVSKKDMWLSAAGIVADWQIPEFMDEFNDKYPGLFIKGIKEPDKALFETRLGRLSKIFDFLLKGKTSDVKKNIGILTRVEDPYEILDGTTSRGKFLLKKIEKTEKLYNDLLKEAVKAKTKDQLLLFTYPTGKISFTHNISNELHYMFPDKIILVGRKTEDGVKISIRSTKVPLPKKLEKALEGIDGYGGGHEFACGGNIQLRDFNEFVENFKKQL